MKEIKMLWDNLTYNRMSEEFSRIYRDNFWVCGSGLGSLPDRTEEYVKFLLDILKDKDITSVLDYGCGDWQFSRHIDWPVPYKGVDIVESVINNNKQKYEKEGICFEVVGKNFEMPHADLIICKDVMQHLPNQIVQDLFSEMKKRCRYLLITNDVISSATGDCEIGGWREYDILKFLDQKSIDSLKWYSYDGVTDLKTTVLIAGDLTS